MKFGFNSWLPATAMGLILSAGVARAGDPAAEAPHVALDKSPRIVAYQLGRLSNAQLIAVERKTDDPKYAPVYQAILTRKGMERRYRDDALASLAQLEKSDPVVELLTAIGQSNPDDKSTARELVGMLMTQKAAALTAQRDKIQSLATDSENDLAKQAGYAALVAADAKPDTAWQLATSKDAVKLLVAGIPWIREGTLRSAFYPQVNPLVDKSSDAQVAAIEAVGFMPGHEADVFTELAKLVNGSMGDVRDAAIKSLRRIPADKWPDGPLEPLADSIVKLVEETPASERTSPSIAMAVQLGNDLCKELGGEKAQAVRKKLRELVVPVIVIRTLREQMQYDTRYFTVQASKPVQIILDNGDAMPHNLCITTPGAMQEVAIAAAQMPPPTDADDKHAYIPDSPKVLGFLSMVQPDENATMTFTAPKDAGQYDFVCTFPGHYVRMYGVMLVVPDLETWEKNPSPPADPMTGKTYEGQKNEAMDAPVVEHQH